MTEITQSLSEKHLRSHLRDIVFSWLQHVSKNLNRVGLNNVVYDLLHSMSCQIVDSMNEDVVFSHFLTQDDYHIVFKKTHYNLCIIINNHRKYKITIGINARIAHRNCRTATTHFQRNPSISTTSSISGPDYHIECSDIIEGRILQSVFFKNVGEDPLISIEKEMKNINFDIVLKLVENFVKINYNVVDKNPKDPLFYPNDNHPGNFLIVHEKTIPELVCIDYDHILSTPSENYIDNVVNTFFQYIHEYEDIKFYSNWWAEHVLKYTIDESKEMLRESIKNGLYK